VTGSLHRSGHLAVNTTPTCPALLTQSKGSSIPEAASTSAACTRARSSSTVVQVLSSTNRHCLPQHSHGPVTTHPHRQCLQAGLDQLPLVHLIILSCFEVDSVNQFPGAQLSWQGRDGSARVSCGQTRVSGQAVTP
jgi:hypothetical protein